MFSEDRASGVRHAAPVPQVILSASTLDPWDAREFLAQTLSTPTSHQLILNAEIIKLLNLETLFLKPESLSRK